jgi:DNA-binding NarL/FixJ family response regulator
MTREPITLLLVDDHPVVRGGLRGMFATSPDFTVLAEATGGREAVTLAERLDPDVVLMDLRMPEGNGVEAITELTRRGLRCRVLVLTTYDTDSDVIPAIEAGATGYLLKDAPPDELFEAVRAAAENRTALAPSVAALLVARLRTPPAPAALEDLPALSAREKDVLTLVAKGTTNREIARKLFISEATVKTHLTHLYAKLGVNDRAAAVATAYERGILS